MSTLFLIENDVALWKGTPVQHSDFANIREFVDACLKPDKAPPHLRPDLTSDFDQLLKLVSVLDSTIPWPSIEQLSNAIPEIPPPPPKPTMPFNPSGVPLKIDEAAKHLAKLTLELDALNTRIKDGEFGLSFKQNKLTTEKAACNTYISQLSEWKKAMAQWHIATDEYNQQLPQFKRKVGHHKRLITTYQSSILHKKIIKRLVLDLNAAISNGGLVFDQLNWKLLPEGEPLTQSINRYLIAAKRRYPDKKLENSRITRILSLTPSKAYIGNNEFDGYIVFLFSNSPYAVLECPWSGNALYLLKKDNWANLSKLSKSTLLHHQGKHARRIIHDSEGNWFHRLKRQIHA